jgi:hypothetical protein
METNNEILEVIKTLNLLYKKKLISKFEIRNCLKHFINLNFLIIDDEVRLK